jgi:hypothetical protein
MTSPTFRSIFIGGLLLILTSFLMNYDRLLIYFLLTVVLLLNPLLTRIKPALRFTFSELTIIYIMVIVGAPIFGTGWAHSLMHTRVSFRYYATPENGYQRDFFAYVKDWFGPTDMNAVRGFFEGGMAVPWLEWMPTLLIWGAFTVALYFTFVCLTALIKDHWIKHEKLSFPILKLPMALLEGFSDGKHSLLKNKLLWIGVAIPVILHTLNGLNHYFPGIPAITTHWDLSRQLTAHPWNAMWGLGIYVRPIMIGFSYLMNLEISFSLWFFFILMKLQLALSAAMAWGAADSPMAGFPFATQQGWGAIFALAGIYIWMMRRHLKESFIAAFLQKTVDKSKAVLAAQSRLPWIGFISGSVFILAFSAQVGMSLLVSVIFFGMILLNVLVLTRFRAEAGLIPLASEQSPAEFVVQPLGSNAVGIQNMTAMGFFGWIMQDTQSTWMPQMMDGFKLEAEHKKRYRALIAVMLVALAISLCFASWSYLTQNYKYGANALNDWRRSEGHAHFQQVSTLVQNPQKVLKPPMPTFFVLVGSAVTVFMQFMRMRFIWWPLHPIGYAAANSFFMSFNISCIFFGWLARLVIFKLAGSTGYKQALPFFLGLILGDLVILGFWDLVGFFVRGAGYYATGY